MGPTRAKLGKLFHRDASSSQTIGTASASKDTYEPSTATKLEAEHSDEAPALVSNTNPANPSRKASRRTKPLNDTLWEDAYAEFASQNQQLAEAYREVLAGVTGIPASLNVVDQAQAVLKKKLDRMVEKQWKFQFRNKSITLRSEVDQIVKILSVFKEVGSSLAGLDPVHAGLPWAAICFLIAPVLNNEEQHKAAVETITKITFIVSRYANLVDTYLDEKDENSDDDSTIASQLALETSYTTAIQKLYCLILTCLASAVRHLNRATLMQIGRNSMKLDDWKGMYDKIVTMDAECMNYPEMCMAFKGKFFQQRMMDFLTRQEKRWSDLCAVQQTEEVRRMLAQISEIQVEQHHEDVRHQLGSRYWGSGKWLLHHADYLDWERSSKNFLWLCGPVGVGKTCLASIVIQNAVWKMDEERVLFFYCSRSQLEPRRNQRNETEEIFRSLLAQLSVDKRGQLASSIPKDILGKRGLSLQECHDLIIDIASQSLGVTIVLDAFDECDQPRECASYLSSLYAKCECIKIFVTSRLNVRFDDIPDRKMITQLETGDDIENYIEEEVSLPARREESQMTSEQAERFKLLLRRRAQGMFRWVELALELVLDEEKPIDHPDDVEAMLNQLSKSPGKDQLNNTYSEVFNKNIRSDSNRTRHLAIKSLQWVYHSYQRLSLEFLVQAVALNDEGGVDRTVSGKWILARCSNFIIETPSGDVKFAHKSVKEYLRSCMGDDFSDAKLHNTIASSCLTFLLKSSRLPLHNHEEAPDLELTSFETYACLHWPFHCEATTPWINSIDHEKEISSSRRLTRDLLHPSGNDYGGSVAFRKWLSFLQLYLITEPYLDEHKEQRLVDSMSKPANIWFTACIWGLLPYHELYEKMTIPLLITQLNGKGRSPLLLACVNGQQHTVKLLLGSQVTLEASQLGILIQAAARSGDLGTLQETLSYGRKRSIAAVNAAPGVYGRSLNAGLSSGNPQIAIELLRSGAEVWLPVTTIVPTTIPPDMELLKEMSRKGSDTTNTSSTNSLEDLSGPENASSPGDLSPPQFRALMEKAGHLRSQLRNAFKKDLVLSHPEAENSVGAQQDRAVIDDALSMFSKPTEFGAKMVQCPFCFRETMDDDPEERTKHLIADLRPYMCTNSTCSIYGKLLGSREEWREHVLTSHDVIEDLCYGSREKRKKNTEELLLWNNTRHDVLEGRSSSEHYSISCEGFEDLDLVEWWKNTRHDVLEGRSSSEHYSISCEGLEDLDLVEWWKNTRHDVLEGPSSSKHYLTSYEGLEDPLNILFMQQCPQCDQLVVGSQANLKMVDKHLGPHMQTDAVKALQEFQEDDKKALPDTFSWKSSSSGRTSVRSWSSGRTSGEGSEIWLKEFDKHMKLSAKTRKSLKKLMKGFAIDWEDLPELPIRSSSRTPLPSHDTLQRGKESRRHSL